MRHWLLVLGHMAGAFIALLAVADQIDKYLHVDPLACIIVGTIVAGFWADLYYGQDEGNE